MLTVVKTSIVGDKGELTRQQDCFPLLRPSDLEDMA